MAMQLGLEPFLADSQLGYIADSAFTPQFSTTNMLVLFSLIAAAVATESEISSQDGGLNMRVGRQSADALVTR